MAGGAEAGGAGAGVEGVGDRLMGEGGGDCLEDLGKSLFVLSL